DTTPNQAATIEVYRQKLVVGTKPFEMVRTVTDAGTDTLTVNATNAAGQFTLTDTTLTGVKMLSQIDFTNIEAINLTTGDFQDSVAINKTITGSVVVTTAGGADTVNVTEIDGATTLHLGTGADTVHVGSLAPLGNGTANNIRATLTVD